MAQSDGRAGSRDEMLCLVAGVADVVAEGLRGLTRRMPGPAEVRQELRARGELALRRNGQTPEAHLEVLARQAAARLGDG
ncbi:hypothetical protein ACIBI3_40375 [Actinomadura luteofluorescens]|uniref:hypothetical protein n=1 Tax=Actinomadura luteofluorescens TaxID=46163 RepID=UPI00347DB112